MGTPNFRAGVVTVVRRGDGKVLAFERADPRGAWQLPQGGIDEGETPVEAAWRELAEETGLGPDDVRLVAEHPHWTIYEWPTEVRAGKDAAKVLDRLGQAHRWFFFEPLDGDVSPVPDGDEFVAWRWMDPQDLIAGVAEFRRPGYAQVLGRDG